MKRITTGIKPSGNPHLGNYLGMFKPALNLAKQPNVQCFYFLADIHALTTLQDRDKLKQYIYEVAAAWIALGLDPEKDILYKESDIPEIAELNVMLPPVIAKSLLNQAHAYKAITARNKEDPSMDIDEGVNMALFNYPILMAADILAFDTDLVPVGKDQAQHIDITRDIARRFNVRFGDVLKLPNAMIQDDTATVPGIDGRKMSKSYDNVIPLFCTPKEMQKLINRIVTDTSPPEAPKDPDTSTLFDIYKGFATAEQTEDLRKRYLQGIGWGAVKKELFEVIQSVLAEPYKIYTSLVNDRSAIDAILKKGAEKARPIAEATVKRAKDAVGF